MKYTKLILGLLSSSAPLIANPTENDPNAGLQIRHNAAANTLNVNWFARESNYYFLMETTDLASEPWTYFPYAVLGSNSVEGIEMQMPADTEKMFFRLSYTNDEDSTLLTSDFDNDGISNGDELRNLLNIYDNSDLNGDGVPDDWESFFGANIDSADNDGDGWTNLEEYSMGTNPNLVNQELAPPTFELQGDFSKNDDVYSIRDGGKIAAYINTRATIGVTHYRIGSPLLPPKILFDGVSTDPVSLPDEPARFEPRTTEASVVTTDNGIYTIKAKTYAEIDGVLHESATATFTLKVRPYESQSASGSPRYSTGGAYDIVTRLWYSGTFGIPENQRRYVSNGWFLEPVAGVSGAYAKFIPDFTRSTSNINAVPGIEGYSASGWARYFGITDQFKVRSFGKGWVTGVSFYTDFSDTQSRADYFMDKRNGLITDWPFDIDDQYRESLGRGWLTGDGFLPDRSYQYDPADDVYFNRFTGRLTYDKPSILDPDEDLGKGWISGWASRFTSEDSVKDTDLDLLADSIARVYEIPVDPTSPGPKDSDGDGRYDFEEFYFGGSPVDSLDIFPAANSFFASVESLIPIIFTVGDPSGSHSEQWELQIFRLDSLGNASLVEIIRADLGTLASRIFSVPAGVGHSIILNHIRGRGDFDYTFTVRLGSDAPAGSGIVISDPNDITGTHSNVSLSSVSGTVTVTPPKACLKGPAGERLTLGVGSSHRTEVYFEAGPLQGPGSFVLAQNNSKIRAWDSPSGGNLVTSPSQPVKVWNLGSGELAGLVAGKRLWIEGLQTSSALNDTTLNLKYLDEDGNQVGLASTLYMTLLELNLIGHLPGTGGAPIPESLEDDPNNLILEVNNNYDEGRVNSQGEAITDSEPPADGIDTALDQDFIKVTISLPNLFNGNEGTFELYARSVDSVRRLPINTFLNVYTADGRTEFGGDDFELNIASPQGPLAGLVGDGSVSLLVEAKQNTYSEFKLCARYRPNSGGLAFEDSVAVKLLNIGITGYLPGPNGQRISGSDEDDPDKLVIAINDNFDEDRRENRVLQADHTDDQIDLAKDQDYSKITLHFPAGIEQGTLSLRSSCKTCSGQTVVPSFFLNVFTEDGLTKLDTADFTLDLANPEGPLTGLTTNGEVTLLIEGSHSSGVEDVYLIWRYENGPVPVQDELHFQLIDVDFTDTVGPGALDDDDESSAVPHRWAMMVPLSAGDDSTGNGEVQVTVSPSSLASKVQLDWAVGADAPSSFGPHTMSSGTETLTIDGSSLALDKALEVKWQPSAQIIDGLNVDFMPRRPKDTAQTVKVALWEIRATGGLTPSVPYDQQAILDFLEASWTHGANVHFEIVQDWKAETVDYDLDSSDTLSEQGGLAEYTTIISAHSNPGADVDVYLVKNMSSQTAARFPDSKATFVAENTKSGISSPLSALAQEVGHVLGVPENDDDDEDSGNVMSDPQVIGATQIRKDDWRVVNP